MEAPFRDLVTGRPVHGWLRLTAELADSSDQVSFSAEVRDVKEGGRPPERQISKWSLRRGNDEVKVIRKGFDEQPDYDVSVSGTEKRVFNKEIYWNGLIPKQPANLADWVGKQVNALRDWSSGVRYLQCPRYLPKSPITAVDQDQSPKNLGSHGQDAPLVLAADDRLRDSVRKWFREVFGVSLDLTSQGRYFDLEVGTPASGVKVSPAHSGQGISSVLPVVVTALMARDAGPGVDIIEHPTAELHPAVHAQIAELLLDNLAGSTRPLIVETHSEMLLLRVRRWIAEKKLPSDNVRVYWVDAQPERGSFLQKIIIDERGAVQKLAARCFQ